MKRIEAIIPQSVIETTTEELMKLGVSGVTIYDCKGIGVIERPEVISARGTVSYRPFFNTNSSIVLVVKDSVVNEAVEKIMKYSTTGKHGEGKIFISDVSDAIDVGSKKRGESAIT